MLKKPSWFRLIDLLTIAGFGVPIIALGIYALLVGASGPAPVQGIILTFVVGFGFIAIWARFALARKQWLDKFRWYQTYGIMVETGDWTAPSDFELDALVKKTVEKWQSFFSNSQDVLMKEVKWAYFKKDLDETTLNPAHQKVKGVTIAGGYAFEVDFDAPGDAIENTAFAHELGHVIMGHATGNWNQAYHHEFMAKNGFS